MQNQPPERTADRRRSPATLTQIQEAPRQTPSSVPRRLPFDLGAGIRYDTNMEVVTGKVVAGRVVIEGEPLEEGSTVTVLAPERDEAFVLDADAEAALLAAIAEADRGETITDGQLMDRLRDPA